MFSTCSPATQQQISELHVCFIMFWFNYISRCSCMYLRKFPFKPIGTIVKLALKKRGKNSRSEPGSGKYWWNTLVKQMSIWYARKHNQFQSTRIYSFKNAFRCLTSNDGLRIANWEKSINCMWCLCLQAIFKCQMELSSNEFFSWMPFTSSALKNYLIS